MGVTVNVECLKNVIVSDSSCCSQHDHEAFTGIRVTIGLKRYYFRPYSILLYKKGQITIRDIENSVSFKEADSNQTFAQIRSLIANCAACGCDAVPVLLTSPNNTIDINTLPNGVTELETDLSNLASSDPGNRLGQGSDTLWYVPPVTWAIISGAQNVVNVGDFNNDVGYLTSVGWSDLTGAQNVIPLSGFNNDIGFITGVTWAQITGSQAGINLSLFNNDANFISVGDNISDLNNDLNFISLGDDISLLNNNANYVDAAGAAAAAPIQSVTGTTVDNTDSANPVVNTPTYEQLANDEGSAPSNKDLKQYNNATSEWENKSIVEIIEHDKLSTRIALGGESGFVIQVDTSIVGTGTVTGSNQFEFTGASGNYDVQAWQNGVIVQYYYGLSGAATITLPTSGIYDLRVLPASSSGFDKLIFNNSGDRNKLLKIRNWGSVIWGFNSLQSAYRGCSNLTSVTSGNPLDLSNTGVGLQSMFFSCSSLTKIDMNGWNTENVQFFDGIFFDCSSLNEVVGINNINTSSSVRFVSMFRSSGLNTIDISNWNLSSLGALAFNSFTRSSGLSCQQYTKFIVDVANFVFENSGLPASLDLQNQFGMTFANNEPGGANFADAQAARAYLVGTGATISGDTVVSNC